MLLAEYCSVPPPKLIVPEVPTALALPKASTPSLIVVPPVYELEPESVSVPVPNLVSEPPLLVSGEASVTFCPLVSML